MKLFKYVLMLAAFFAIVSCSDEGDGIGDATVGFEQAKYTYRESEGRVRIPVKITGKPKSFSIVFDVRATVDPEKGMVDGKPVVVDSVAHFIQLENFRYVGNPDAPVFIEVELKNGFLKAYYPAEFMAANLSNNLSDISKVTVFMDECKRMGLNVLAPDVNEFYNDFTVNSHGQIRFGMAAIKGVGEAAVEKIIEEREKNGPYKDVYDFFERIDYKTVNKKTLENLIDAGGLDSFGYHRAQYHKSVDATTVILDTLVNYGQKNQQDSMNMAATLFGELEGFEVTKPNIPDCEPWHDYEKPKKEKELIGIYCPASLHRIANPIGRHCYFSRTYATFTHGG